MNENLIKELKHLKKCLVKKEMVGDEWEERQAILGKLEEAVTYLNDAAGKGIDFEE